MIRVVTTWEPVVSQTFDLMHPHVPGEPVTITVSQRHSKSAFGLFVSSDLSGTACGAWSGRALPHSTWTPQIREAFTALSRECEPQPRSFSMSPLGYVLVAVMVMSLMSVVWGVTQPLRSAGASDTYAHAQQRVEAAFESPGEGTLVFIGEPDGTAFRWYRVQAIDAVNLRLVGTSETYPLDFALPRPEQLRFAGETLVIPRAQFTVRDGTLEVDGTHRLVSNARP